jgi:ribose transport system substrate-binding protein
MRKIALMLVCVAAVVCLCSCSKKEPAGGEKKLTIAVIPKGTTHIFWQSVHAGALKAAAEFDVEI